MRAFSGLFLQLGLSALVGLNLSAAKSHNHAKHSLDNERETSFAENVTVTLTEPIYHKRNPAHIDYPSHKGESFVDFSNKPASNKPASMNHKGKGATPTIDTADQHIDRLSKLGEKYTDNGEDFRNHIVDNVGHIKHYSTTIKRLNITDGEIITPDIEVRPAHAVHFQHFLPAGKDHHNFKLQELAVVKEGNILVGRVYNGHLHQFEPIFTEKIPDSYQEALKHTEL